MRARFPLHLVGCAVLAALALAAAAHAAPTACSDTTRDLGDAPEGVDAYPGVPGRFPTCIGLAAPAGTQEAACTPRGSLPGPTGHVLHVSPPNSPIWFGCGQPQGTGGIDSEADAKINVSGSPGAPSVCGGAPTDCAENGVVPLTAFGQDECLFDNVDAGLLGPTSFVACSTATIVFYTYLCAPPGPVDYGMVINMLVDWNMDGDWNDTFICPESGQCVDEWAIKNDFQFVSAGCAGNISRPFRTGSRLGKAWMRLTVTREFVPDDFPWNGSAGTASGSFGSGETEDYLITIRPPDPCEVTYSDYGDAPEDVPAYPGGVIGHFPTCRAATPAGAQEVGCGVASGPVIGSAGYVVHYGAFGGNKMWLGCGFGVDTEGDGRINLSATVGDSSVCQPFTFTQCVETTLGGMTFGQDECAGDGVDSGLDGPIVFASCKTTELAVNVSTCGPGAFDVVLNVLVDWNHDGDWNDNVACEENSLCAPEWAVKNLPQTLEPGCHRVLLPFIAGPEPGPSWMRVTVTPAAVRDDFPWNGSLSEFNSYFTAGETEDYPVDVVIVDTGAPDPTAAIPSWLGSARPNPARRQTTIPFTLPRGAFASVAVFDASGRRLRTLTNAWTSAGPHEARWDFRDDRGRLVPVGVYLVRLEVEGRTFTGRVTRVE